MEYLSSFAKSLNFENQHREFFMQFASQIIRQLFKLSGEKRENINILRRLFNVDNRLTDEEFKHYFSSVGINFEKKSKIKHLDFYNHVLGKMKELDTKFPIEVFEKYFLEALKGQRSTSLANENIIFGEQANFSQRYNQKAYEMNMCSLENRLLLTAGAYGIKEADMAIPKMLSEIIESRMRSFMEQLSSIAQNRIELRSLTTNQQFVVENELRRKQFFLDNLEKLDQKAEGTRKVENRGKSKNEPAESKKKGKDDASKKAIETVVPEGTKYVPNEMSGTNIPTDHFGPCKCSMNDLKVLIHNDNRTKNTPFSYDMYLEKILLMMKKKAPNE
ncbi:hypothetical protein SNEBB_002833 [Seison nebaliae]|nr:hypothetical protein SNEBB_002833 [Seison nebaliae]